MSEELLQRFAELVVRVGANVQPGQGVVVTADVAQAEIARAVVERAYVTGASWVEVLWSDAVVRRSDLTHADLATLTADRPWALERTRGWADDGIASIALVGTPDPNLYAGIDPVRVAAVRMRETMARQQAVMSGRWRWTVVTAPNADWATQVYGEPDIDRLWDVVAQAMRLNETDPVEAWRERSAALAARCAALDALQISEIRYVGEGTDLTVGLLPDCRWTGGSAVDPAGIRYLPNLPTEEVFTSPDRRRAEGVVRLTKPVVIAGRLVEGLRLTFADGRITEVSATTGADLVRSQLDTDPGARSLGEVALVDKESRIAQAGLVFHNTLFDENAGCHVAWGQSFPFAVESGLQMTPDERYALGLNNSTVHTDVVLGGEGLTVTATTPGGPVVLLRDDTWLLPAS
ncbi:aminopeptidase [Kribbella orskensis]|uniref:Aminopeptidase n=1 Tax=Kribbella orskensis TaxID=2512216 RepID=A0ABY2BT70_9ACTN|nr:MULTISPECIES: aminopeptidase [Kribbella]TCN43190.1 aminopeptidase [Kribbella sp. VKM Ac-2500]TCO29454.1 aminopeptidase [Kribbella orskensis]